MVYVANSHSQAPPPYSYITNILAILSIQFQSEDQFYRQLQSTMQTTRSRVLTFCMIFNVLGEGYER